MIWHTLPAPKGGRVGEADVRLPGVFAAWQGEASARAPAARLPRTPGARAHRTGTGHAFESPLLAYPAHYAIADGEEVTWVTDPPPADCPAERVCVDRDAVMRQWWKKRQAAQQEHRDAERRKKAAKQRGLAGGLSFGKGVRGWHCRFQRGPRPAPLPLGTVCGRGPRTPPLGAVQGPPPDDDGALQERAEEAEDAAAVKAAAAQRRADELKEDAAAEEELRRNEQALCDAVFFYLDSGGAGRHDQKSGGGRNPATAHAFAILRQLSGTFH
eukprot:gene7467-2060_t